MNAIFSGYRSCDFSNNITKMMIILQDRNSMARRNLSIILTLSMICNFLFLNHLIRREVPTTHQDVELIEKLAKRADVQQQQQYNPVRRELMTMTKEAEASATSNSLQLLSLLVDSYLNRELLFVVGAMSSGTTLMRLILDVHPEVNCGDETKIVHLMLEFVESIYRDPFYVQFMNHSGVKNETINKVSKLYTSRFDAKNLIRPNAYCKLALQLSHNYAL